MTIFDFKPYKFPIPAMAGWDRYFNKDQARAHIAPRGNVFAFQIPKNAKRYILVNYPAGWRAFDREGRNMLTFPDLLREVANRLPPDSIVDTFISPEKVTIVDVLYYNNLDIRNQSLEARIGYWWYMPQEYRNRVFYNESNSDKLNADILKDPFARVIFKPDFVRYPKTSSRRKVYNWLEMIRDPDAVNEQPGNLSNLLLRRAGLSGATRSQEVTP